MRILVTNDDGVDAPGLCALAAQLQEAGHDVLVVAPGRDFSGSGGGLGTLEDGARISWRPGTIAGFDGRVVAVDAPPSFAVLAACSRLFGPSPDMVVSGINDGFNTGRLLSASSTVGAALTASTLGLLAIAVSTAEEPHARYDTAAAVAVRAVQWLAGSGRRAACLNINVPGVELSDIGGVVAAPLAPRGLMGLALELDGDAVVMRRFANTKRIGDDTDAAHVLADRVAVTALSPVGADALDLAGLDALLAGAPVAID